MAIVHSFNKYKDVYTLSNQGVDTFTYTFTKVSCDAETLYVSGTIVGGNSVIIPINLDGVYNLTLSQESESDITIPVYHYLKLIKSFIYNVKDILCGCKCVDCDCENNCDNSLLTLLKASTYSALNSEALCSIYSCVSSYTSCNLEDSSLCLLTQEFILGSGKSEALLKNLLVTYYLTFYFNELNLSLDEEEKNYIKAKYDSDDILLCIKKLGFDVKGILCNPEIPLGPCQGWEWNLGAVIDENLSVSIKYFACDTDEEVILTGTILELGRIINICTNGITPIINIGSLIQLESCLE